MIMTLCSDHMHTVQCRMSIQVVYIYQLII